MATTFALLTDVLPTSPDCISRVWQDDFTDNTVIPSTNYPCITVWLPGAGKITVFCDHFRDVVDRIRRATQSGAQPAVADTAFETAVRGTIFVDLGPEGNGYVLNMNDVQEWEVGTYAEGEQYLKDREEAEAQDD